MTFEVPTEILDCPWDGLRADLAAVWRGGASALPHWPDRPTSDGDPVAFGALDGAQAAALGAWVTAQRQAIARAYGFETAGDLDAFQDGAFGLEAGAEGVNPVLAGGPDYGEPRTDADRLARRREAVRPAWAVLRDYAPGAPGGVRAAALSRLARFMGDSSPGVESEEWSGAFGGGEGQATSSVTRKTTYGRSDRPLHQSGAAALLARWRVFRAGVIG